MPTYAIGDIQGCYDSLRGLLSYIGFDPRNDRLWLVGDLVNRGPKSLEVLRWARSLEDRIVAVLGNHDIHLLLRSVGAARRKKRDTLGPILESDDGHELLQWLRMRPLLHTEGSWAMVHAGLHPEWSLAEAAREAELITDILRADDWRARIVELAGKKPPAWSPDLPAAKRVRAAAAVFWQMRTCRSDGSLCEDFKGPVTAAPNDCTPWFKIRSARWRDYRVIFGHWATLGLLQGKYVLGLDTGCVWGGALTACRLDDGQIFQVPAAESSYSPIRSL